MIRRGKNSLRSSFIFYISSSLLLVTIPKPVAIRYFIKAVHFDRSSLISVGINLYLDLSLFKLSLLYEWMVKKYNCSDVKKQRPLD